MSSDPEKSTEKYYAELEEKLGTTDSSQSEGLSREERFAKLSRKLEDPHIREERAFVPKREDHRTEHFPSRPFPDQNLSETRVYLISTDIYTKIGISKSPESRLASIQSHTPLPAELITTIRSTRPEKTEAHLHEAYKDRQTETGREWFILPDAEIDRLKEIEVLTGHGAKLLYEDEYLPSRIPEKYLR